jgi:YjbE family integral membrane protein
MLDQLDLAALLPGGFADNLAALAQVLLIDLVLAGDNAVAVGLAASGLNPKDRRKAIFWGLVAAVVTRIGFALITVQLLQLIGLLLAGGLLLLWVCWKMWRDLREHGREATARAEACLGVDDRPAAAAQAAAPAARPKSFGRALLQIMIADVSMSLDNVLAVAGAAREHPAVLVVGLLLSIALMGAAATVIARLLHRFRWIGYLGLAIVVFVALRMIWDGSHEVLTSGLPARAIVWIDALCGSCLPV